MDRVSADFLRSTGWWCICIITAVILSGCASSFNDTSRSFNTVVIDAGHGGHDSGARGVGGIREKNVALDVSQRLERHLRAAGFKTIMTRNDDRFIPLGSRASTFNSQKNAVFVSVHFNYAKRRAIGGAETYFHHAPSRGIAASVQRELARVTTNRGVLRANFHVLRNATAPAILVECGYLTNRAEGKRAASAAHRELLAQKIATGIINHRYPHGRPGRAQTLAQSSPTQPSAKLP